MRDRCGAYARDRLDPSGPVSMRESGPVATSSDVTG
jgi:hypothetical protein